MSLSSKIKPYVPKSLRRRLSAAFAPIRDRAEERALWRLPAGKIDPSHLRPISADEFNIVFHDPMIQEGYLQDHETISKIFPASDIFGGVNPGDRRALYYTIAALRPQTVLEVGTHIGASTIYMGMALRRFVGVAGGLTTVDIVDVNGPHSAWKKLGLPKPPVEFIDRLGLTSQVKFLTLPAVEALNADRRYDFIFLDGDHSAAAVYREITSALNALNEMGVIMLHDFYPKSAGSAATDVTIRGPASAAARIEGERSDVRFLPLKTLPWTTRGQDNTTSLAVVGRVG